MAVDEFQYPHIHTKSLSKEILDCDFNLSEGFPAESLSFRKLYTF